MGDRQESDTVDTAGVAVSSEVQDGCFHVAGDTGSSPLLPAGAPTGRDRVFPGDS